MAAPKTHGMTKTITYGSWTKMKSRCLNLNHVHYCNYGGSGITVCKRWLKFENFLKDMGPRPSLEYSLDRINNNKGYSKSNCRWATHKEQAHNRHNSIVVVYKNKKVVLASVVEEKGLAYRIAYTRIFKYKWTIEQALDTPVARRGICGTIQKHIKPRGLNGSE